MTSPKPVQSRIALVLGLTLGVLHFDFWRPRGASVWFGWMPEELVYRVAWMGLAFLYLVWLSVAVWSGDE